MSDKRDDIQQGIADLTRRRADQAPDFESVLNPTAPPGVRRRLVLGWLGAAAILVLGLSLWLVMPNPEAERRELLARLEMVSDWQAPSDVFLPSLNHRWLREAPPLGRADLTIYTGTEQR